MSPKLFSIPSSPKLQWVELPPEIITEILLLLPVKSLIRFQCVSKSWFILINDPKFIKNHLNQSRMSKSNGHLLIYYSSLHSAELKLELDHQPNHLIFSEHHHPLTYRSSFVKLLGSCNGVVCVSDYYQGVVFLYNPLTRSHRKLPSIPVPNPWKNCTAFGFGYDSVSDDYKVLRMVQGHEMVAYSEDGDHFYENDETFANEAIVYSLNNNSWKYIEGIPYKIYYSQCDGLLLYEALHYLATKQTDSSNVDSIASFNLHTESFSLIEFPDYDEKYRVVNVLKELGGWLCMAVNYICDCKSLNRADLWVMKEYGNKESWVKLYSICEPSRSLWCFVSLNSIVYSNDGRKILLEVDNSKFVWYDLESKTVERLTAQGLPHEPLATEFFVASLVSVGEKLRPETEREVLPRKKTKKNDARFRSLGRNLRL